MSRSSFTGVSARIPLDWYDHCFPPDDESELIASLRLKCQATAIPATLSRAYFFASGGAAIFNWCRDRWRDGAHAADFFDQAC